MATDAEVRSLMLEPMTALYSVPHGVNPDRALPEYLQALKPYPLASLEGAWISIRNNRAKATWPTIGEVVTAARDWIHANVKSESIEERAKPTDWKRYPDLADKAMTTNHGQRALSEGWARILYDYVLKNGTFQGFTAAHAITIDAEVRRTVAELEVETPRSALMTANLNLGRKILAREDDLRKRFMQEAA